MRRKYKITRLEKMYRRECGRQILEALRNPNDTILCRELKKISRRKANAISKEDLDAKIQDAKTWTYKFLLLEEYGIKLTDSLKNKLRTKSWEEIRTSPEVRRAKVSMKTFGVELKKLTEARFVERVGADGGYRINLELDEDLSIYDRRYRDSAFMWDSSKWLTERQDFAVYHQPSRKIRENFDEIVRSSYPLLNKMDEITGKKTDCLVVIRFKREKTQYLLDGIRAMQ